MKGENFSLHPFECDCGETVWSAMYMNKALVTFSYSLGNSLETDKEMCRDLCSIVCAAGDVAMFCS